MKPILFSENTTQFNTNGLGRLDCISCVVTEERNGEYTLSMEIAETTLHANEIRLSSIIVVKPSEGTALQAFRVYKITKPLKGVFTVQAEHISYQLSCIPTMPFTINADIQACAQTLAKLKTNAVEACPFTFSTDVTTVASYIQTVPASIRSRLGGVEGSVLDQFGGEFEWDNYNVILHKNRGRTVPNVSLRYGKNIIDLNQETNIENTITGIVPYWRSTDDKDIVTLPEKVINGAHASSFPFKRTVPMDFSQDFEKAPTFDQLRLRAQHYVNASGIGVPKVSIKLSFIHLADTEEYKNLAALQTVKLCDNVEVYFEKLGIATTAKIVRTEYDVLLERYNTVEIGDLRSTLSGVINSTEGAIAKVANDTRRMFQNFDAEIGHEIETEISNATKWLTGSNGYVMAVKNTDGTWKELLFVDSNNPAQVHNVLRINENGIGFSSNGINGPYHQGWTLDGRMLIGGTNIPALTVYQTRAEEAQDHKDHNLLFKVSNEGMEWHAVNSDLSKSGTLTIKKTYSDGTVKTIGIWDDNGLVMYDGNGTEAANVIGSWSANGIDVKRGSIEGTSLKVGTNNSAPGSIYIYDGNGTDSSHIIGYWTKDGLDAKKGSISGSSIKVGGNGNNPGSITVYDEYGTESSNVIGTWDKNGLDVKDGTITGATVRSNASGRRIQMDKSYTLKGIGDDDQIANFIDMMQPGSTEMNIGASKTLNVMTPQLAVGTSTDGNVTITKTTSESASDPNLHPNRRLYNVRKIYLSNEDPDPWAVYYNVQDKMQMGWVPFYHKDEETGEYSSTPFDYVYCTLPVMLLLEGDDESLIHGMVTTNSDFTPQINI